MIPMTARSSLSKFIPSGRNSGKTTEAMNNTLISGTPRTNSMNATDTSRNTGSRERRPSASTMPIGSEPTMPTVARMIVSINPPHSELSTAGRPSPPANRK